LVAAGRQSSSYLQITHSSNTTSDSNFPLFSGSPGFAYPPMQLPKDPQQLVRRSPSTSQSAEALRSFAEMGRSSGGSTAVDPHDWMSDVNCTAGNVSIRDLMAEMGINLDQIATDFGLNSSKKTSSPAAKAITTKRKSAARKKPILNKKFASSKIAKKQRRPTSELLKQDFFSLDKSERLQVLLPALSKEARDLLFSGSYPDLTEEYLSDGLGSGTDHSSPIENEYYPDPAFNNSAFEAYGISNDDNPFDFGDILTNNDSINIEDTFGNDAPAGMFSFESQDMFNLDSKNMFNMVDYHTHNAYQSPTGGLVSPIQMVPEATAMNQAPESGEVYEYGALL
jgi:hypothetical protein